VEGEGAQYKLHLATAEAVPFDDAWDVVVLDGESLFDDEQRLELMRRLHEQLRGGASILFVCSRLPREQELTDAKAWADDFIYSGWAEAERVQKRVQLVALAPWRRSVALRRHAEEAGDTRLRVLPGGASPAKSAAQAGRQDLAPARMTTTQARLAADAFHEGRRIALVDIQRRVDRACKGLLEEVLGGLDCVEAAQSIKATYKDAASPVVAARFGGASAAVEAVWGTLRQLVREELVQVEQAQVGGS